jgi:hypothetical protein
MDLLLKKNYKNCLGSEIAHVGFGRLEKAA